MHLSLYLYKYTGSGVLSTECCVCTFLENTNILPNIKVKFHAYFNFN